MNDWKGWIERYVHAVAGHLPSGQRSDVAEEVALATIAEFGEPAAVARRYAPERPVLVSPRLYRPMKIAFLAVLGVWSVSAALWLFDIISTTYVFPFRFEFSEGATPGDLIYGLLANLGIVLLVFAAIDRLVGDRWESHEGSWDPRALPDLPGGEPVSRFGSAIGVAIPLYVLYALHVTPEWFGFTVSTGKGGTDYWQLFHPGYRSLLPWIDAWLILSLVLDGWLLWRGERGLAERWLQVGLGALGAVVLFRIAAGGPFTVIDEAVDPVLVVSGIVCAGVAVLGAGRAMRVMRAGRLLPRAT